MKHTYLTAFLKRFPPTTPSLFGLSFVVFACLMGLGGLIWGVLCLSFDLYLPSLIPLGYSVLTGLTLWFWVATKRFRLARFLQVFFSILLPFVFQGLLGGYAVTGLVMLWAVLALVGSLTFYRQAAGWVLWFVVLLLLSLWTEPYHAARAPEILKSVTPWLLGINFGVVSLMLFVLARYFLVLQRKANDQLFTRNQELQRSEEEKNRAYQEVLSSEEELRQNMEELHQLNENLQQVTGELEAALGRESAAKKQLEQQKNDEIARKNTQIMSSIRYAERIQRAFLPEEKDLQAFLPKSFVFFQPRDIVSGDFWWFRPVYSNGVLRRLVLVAADCTGHGVPGAFMSLIGYNLLNSIIMEERITESHRILDRLQVRLRRSLRQDSSENKDGMDLGVVVLDFETQMLEFSGAMNPLIAIQNDTLMLLEGDKVSIGGSTLYHDPAHHYEQHLLYWGNTPTSFYLLSDGFQDQFGGEAGRKFMKRRLYELLKSIHTVPQAEQKEILMRLFEDWKSEQAQIDDVLLIGACIVGT